MRNKKVLTINNVRVGQRVKVGVPRLWMELPNKYGPVVWVRGVVTEVRYNEYNDGKVSSIEVRWKLLSHKGTRNHRFVDKDVFLCTPDIDGEFKSILLCKKGRRDP